MGKREIVNKYLSKVTKILLFINIIIYILTLLGMGFFLLIPNYIFLFLFDIFFLSYVYSSSVMEIQGFPKRIQKKLIYWGLFVTIHIPLGTAFQFFSLYDAMNFMLILFLSLLVYIVALIEKRNHKYIARILLLCCLVICFCIFAFFIYIYWEFFGFIFSAIIEYIIRVLIFLNFGV